MLCYCRILRSFFPSAKLSSTCISTSTFSAHNSESSAYRSTHHIRARQSHQCFSFRLHTVLSRQPLSFPFERCLHRPIPTICHAAQSTMYLPHTPTHVYVGKGASTTCTRCLFASSTWTREAGTSPAIRPSRGCQATQTISTIHQALSKSSDRD